MKFPTYDKRGARQNEFLKKLVRCLAPARLIRALPSLRSEGRAQSATASFSSPYDLSRRLERIFHSL